MMKVSFRNGLMALIVIIFLIFSGMSFYFSSSLLRDTMVKNAIENSKNDISVYVSELESFHEEINSDVLFLSRFSSLEGLIRARLNNGFDVERNLSYEQLKGILENDFKAMIVSSKGLYDQVRYIDENGNEIVRVNLNEGNIEVVSEEELQNKENRYYFREAMEHGASDVYVSRLDLNREGDPPAIEVPYKPIIRYAVPVFDDVGRRRGIVIINVLLNDFFDRLKVMYSRINGDVYILDENGYYLLHPDISKEFGDPFNLDTNESFKRDYPEVAERILSGIDNFGGFVFRDKLFTYRYVYFGGGGFEHDYWVFVKELPLGKVMEGVNDFQKKILILNLFAFLGLIIVAYLLSYLITRPIYKLTRDINEISRGNLDINLKKSRVEEIQDLIDSLNRVIASVKLAMLRTKIKKEEIGVGHLDVRPTELLNTKLFEKSNDCIKIIDLKGKVVYINEGGLKEHNFKKKEEAIGWNWLESVAKEYRRLLKESFSEVAKGKSLSVDVQHIKPYSNREWCNVTLDPIFDDKGRVKNILAISKDITKYKRLEYKLRKDLERRKEKLNALSKIKLMKNSVVKSIKVPESLQKKKQILKEKKRNRE
jgi:PAS domain S-box-containing protein